MTKKEHSSNIVYYCPTCAPKPKYFSIKKPQKLIGQYIKAAFLVEENIKEHMWVLVHHADKGVVSGKLANYPVGAVQYKFGQVVEVPIDQIEDIFSYG